MLLFFFLHAYRGTQYAKTQQSSAEFLHGRVMHPKLNVARFLQLSSDVLSQSKLRATLYQNKRSIRLMWINVVVPRNQHLTMTPLLEWEDVAVYEKDNISLYQLCKLLRREGLICFLMAIHGMLLIWHWYILGKMKLLQDFSSLVDYFRYQ